MKIGERTKVFVLVERFALNCGEKRIASSIECKSTNRGCKDYETPEEHLCVKLDEMNTI